MKEYLDGIWALILEQRIPADNKYSIIVFCTGCAIIGLLVFAIGVCLGGTTGYAINPARDFAPRLVHALLPIPGKRDSDWGYAWVPLAGPIVGGVLAAAVYRLIA